MTPFVFVFTLALVFTLAPCRNSSDVSLMSGASLRGVVKRVGVWVRERSVINHNDNSLWDGALT